MSVVVLGMEMPKMCEDCKIEAITENYYGDILARRCPVTGENTKQYGWKGIRERHPSCPLRPLPEKHGRLIDADAMERLMNFTVQGDIRQYPYSDTVWDTAFRWMDHQITIVEAEE